MRALPFGVPKVMVSTLASGQVRPYVGVRDIIMFNSVVDIAGLNSVSRVVLSHAGLASLGSQWGTSDGIYHRELMVGGPPWEGSPLWTEQSPIMKAANFKTPILLSVGEKDYRVPLNQTLEMWSAVQRMKVRGRRPQRWGVTTTGVVNAWIGSSGVSRLATAWNAGVATSPKNALLSAAT